MNWIVAIALVITSVVLPFMVALAVKATWSANVKRFIAILISVLVGFATAAPLGIPTPETLMTWVLAVVGGMHVAYSLFKKSGVTVAWMEALNAIGTHETREKK